MKNCPEHYAKIAEDAEGRGDFATAVAAWGSARAASLGHDRRDRYERLQGIAERKAVAAGQEIADYWLHE